MHQIFTIKTLSWVKFNLLQRSIGIKRNGSVKQEVLITDRIHTSVRQQHLNMFLQFFTNTERMMQALHQLEFLRCEFIGMLRINSWEMTRTHLVFFSIDGINTTFVVDMLQKTTVFHLPLWTTMEYLGLLLKLNNGNCLVHLSRKTQILVFHFHTFQQFWHKFFTWIISIEFHSKSGQWYKVDTISFLNGRKISIPQRKT